MGSLSSCDTMQRRGTCFVTQHLFIIDLTGSFTWPGPSYPSNLVTPLSSCQLNESSQAGPLACPTGILPRELREAPRPANACFTNDSDDGTGGCGSIQSLTQSRSGFSTSMHGTDVVGAYA